MKRNLTLIFILLALLGVTYYFQEYRAQKEQKQKASAAKLLKTKKMGKLKAIHLKSVTLEKRGDNYYISSKGELADKDRVNFFLGHLRGLSVKRILTEKELAKAGREHFFPPESPSFRFEFEKGDFRFLLGKKVNVDRSFYVEITRDGEKLQAVAVDKGPREGVYSKKNSHRDSSSYNKVKTLLNLPKRFFYNKSLFIDAPKFEKVLSLGLGNERNRSFTIDLKKYQTEPSIYPGVSYDRQKMRDYVTSLLNLKGDSVIEPKQSEQLKSPQSEMVLRIKKQGKAREVRVKLFDKLAEKKGSYAYLTDWPRPGEERLLKLKEKDRGLFFRNRQDFWKKRLLKERPGKARFMFSGEKKERVLAFSRGERFKAELISPEGGKVSHKEFSKLLTFLQKDADFISLTSDDEEKLSENMGRRELFHFSVGQREFQVVETTTEIMVLEKRPGQKKDLRYHYLTGGKTPFGVTWNDYAVR